MPFDLNLPEHLGNCVWCYKKSDRKLYTLARSMPEVFDVPIELESKYRSTGPQVGERVFFRGNRDGLTLLRDAQASTLSDFVDPNEGASDCDESCEVFGAEQLDLWCSDENG